MPHVTFIHGISNMPPKEKLLESWLAALSDGGLDLDTAAVTSSMVYWADVVYAEPYGGGAGYESVDAALGTAATDDDLAWVESLPAEERRVAEALIGKLELDKEPPGGDRAALPERPVGEGGGEDGGEDGGYDFEAIPLPWFIKSRVMKRLLKDVHHYLFNASFSPRPDETYEVRTHIRERFVDQLIEDAAGCDGPHVVVAHSMGTVISYDCLKNVERAPSIDGYITVGSPLGISEIHDNFDPSYSRRDAFPSQKLRGEWINLYDRLDPVAFDARIANDYQRGGECVITDERVRNGGRWRHSSGKYYRQEVFREHLARLLDVA